MKITAIKDDITELDQKYDAIVNAANSALFCGGGVDEEIHRAAGADELHAACMEFPEIEEDVRCTTGTVKTTPAFKLNADHIIHAVGPRWSLGGFGQNKKLDELYKAIIAEAERLECQTIAIPTISTGAYGFPVKFAAQVSIAALLSTRSEIEILIVAFDDENFDAVQLEILNRHANIHGLRPKVPR